MRSLSGRFIFFETSVCTFPGNSSTLRDIYDIEYQENHKDTCLRCQPIHRLWGVVPLLVTMLYFTQMFKAQGSFQGLQNVLIMRKSLQRIVNSSPITISRHKCLNSSEVFTRTQPGRRDKIIGLSILVRDGEQHSLLFQKVKTQYVHFRLRANNLFYLGKFLKNLADDQQAYPSITKGSIYHIICPYKLLPQEWINMRLVVMISMFDICIYCLFILYGSLEIKHSYISMYFSYHSREENIISYLSYLKVFDDRINI